MGLLRVTVRLQGWQPHPGWRERLYPTLYHRAVPRGTGEHCHAGHFRRNCSYRIPAGPKQLSLPNVHVERIPLLPIQAHMSCPVGEVPSQRMGGSCRAAPTLLCCVSCRGFVQRKSSLSLAWSLLQYWHR